MYLKDKIKTKWLHKAFDIFLKLYWNIFVFSFGMEITHYFINGVMGTVVFAAGFILYRGYLFKRIKTFCKNVKHGLLIKRVEEGCYNDTHTLIDFSTVEFHNEFLFDGARLNSTADAYILNNKDGTCLHIYYSKNKYMLMYLYGTVNTLISQATEYAIRDGINSIGFTLSNRVPVTTVPEIDPAIEAFLKEQDHNG